MRESKREKRDRKRLEKEKKEKRQTKKLLRFLYTAVSKSANKSSLQGATIKKIMEVNIKHIE